MKKLIFAAALICTGAQAEFWTGNDLLAKINSNELADRTAAIGYIMGVFDSSHSVSHCPPQNVTAGQVRDMVVKSLNDGVAARHMSADGFVVYTLKNTWPCAKKGTGV